MSIKNYTVGNHELIGDPYAAQEFTRIAAAWKSLQAAILEIEAAKGGDGNNPPGPPPGPPDNPDTGDPPGSTPGVDSELRWLRGPWLIGPDKRTAAPQGWPRSPSLIFPVELSGNVNNYGPSGLHEAILIFQGSSVATPEIRGLKAPSPKAVSLKFFFNYGGTPIHFVNQSTNAAADNRFSWGDSGDSGDIIKVPGGQLIGFMYNPAASRWQLFAIPPVGSENLPPTLVPPEVVVPPFPANHRWWQSFVTDASQTIRAVFIATPGLQGAGGTGGNDIIGWFLTRETGSVVGDLAGVVMASGDGLRGDMDPTWEVVIRTGSVITNYRLWIGLFDTAPDDSDTIVGNGMGFRYSTVASDAGWIGVNRDGTTQSTTSSLGTVSASTNYRLKMRKSGTSVFFSIDGGTETELTTNAPGNSAVLQWYIRVRTQDGGGGGGAVRRISFFAEWGRLRFDMANP